MKLLLLIFGRFSPIVLNDRFRSMQVVSAVMMAFSHGSNDAQKAMGDYHVDFAQRRIYRYSRCTVMG